ncbi:acetolactate synthase [Hahella sp. CCB-MM4]|uniref:thiamine pyrophosphate-binding protein n=1 Tax=Hahella sp. (strain CCB-MM4) TaxID=1926491 RepID=UPI000B9A9AA9|nr:thiamine pyrophosphate-binding protein [Hahella sp. CCB-MM4]OZG71551.1 acetolactate synthase [Hahella sp. CCB-MM4]
MQHGGLIVAETIREQGVEHLFTLCGGHISPILSGCRELGIKVWDTRHEASAVFAADAVSRLSGIPGVAAVTAGPGVTNAVTAIKNAQLAQSPLVLLGGASATVLRGRGSLQDIDQISLMSPHVKATYSVKKVRDIASTLTLAFETAQSGVPGPVFVELPLDILYPESLVREWYGIKGSEQGKGGLAQKAIQKYLDYHTQQLFKQEDAGFVPLAEAKQLSLRLTGMAEEALELVNIESLARLTARKLRHANAPVMVIGSQAVNQPRQLDKLVEAIEHLGIPVFLSGMARGLLGRNHPLQCRHRRKQALRDADFVLLAGVPCDFRLDYGSHINRRATLVSVNLSRSDLFKNRMPNIPVWGSPSEFICRLSSHLKADSDSFASWMQALASTDRQRNQEIQQQAKQHNGHINPLELFQILDTKMEEHAVIIADGGDFVATASYILQPRRPLSWLDPGVFGTLGVGGGFALGASAIRPDSEIWIIYGDGSSAYSLAEFDTFVRHGRGVIAVVGNDGCWNQIARDQVKVLEDDVGVVLRQSDYHIVAKGYGGEALLLDDPKNIRATLTKAKKLAGAGKPVLINVILDKSDFREGSLSV